MVSRVRTEHGSHIDPPFDPAWIEIKRLRWEADVASLDCGLTIKIAPSVCSGYGPHYDVRFPSGSSSLYLYAEAVRHDS